MLNSIVGVLGNGVTVGDYESIATVTVGAGGSSSISFSSIPSTYQHLQIRCIMRDTGTAADWNNVYTTFNSDTAANYSQHFIRAYGATPDIYVSGFANTSNMWIGLLPTSYSGYGSTYAATIFDVLDYADSNKYKTLRSINGVDSNSSTYGYSNFGSGNWRSTSAVNNINIVATGRTFAQYSTFALYGIKG